MRTVLLAAGREGACPPGPPPGQERQEMVWVLPFSLPNPSSRGLEPLDGGVRFPAGCRAERSLRWWGAGIGGWETGGGLRGCRPPPAPKLCPRSHRSSPAPGLAGPPGAPCGRRLGFHLRKRVRLCSAVKKANSCWGLQQTIVNSDTCVYGGILFGENR